MDLKEWFWPDCHLCREIRAAMCAGLIIVLGTYMLQLLNINREMRGKA